MSEQTTQQRQQKGQQHLGTFEVEVSVKNSNPWHSVVLGQTLRGRWSRHNLGSYTASVSTGMSLMPDIPGMRIRITPKDRKVYIHDPLSKNQPLLKAISAVCKESFAGFNGTFAAKEPVEKVLDDDRFVTFLHEIYKSATKANPSLVCVSGEVPTPEQINTLPGRELYDVGGSYKGKPRYVGDEDKITAIMRALEEKGITL